MCLMYVYIYVIVCKHDVIIKTYSHMFEARTTEYLNDMGHGQYLVYSSKSSMFEECTIVFQVLVYTQMLSFLKSVL